MAWAAQNLILLKIKICPVYLKILLDILKTLYLESVLLLFPIKEQKIIFSLEFVHQSYKYNTDSVYRGFAAGKGILKQKILNLNLPVKFLFGRRSVNIFFEGGVNCNYIYQSQADFNYTHIVFGGNSRVFYTRSEGVYFGILAGAGLNINRFSLHCRYINNGLNLYKTFSLFGKYNLFSF